MSYKYNPFSSKLDFYEKQEGQLHIGAGAPLDAIGDDGDIYIDTLTFDIYEKAGGTWA